MSDFKIAILILIPVILLISIFSFLLVANSESGKKCNWSENTGDCKCRYNYGKDYVYSGSRYNPSCINIKTKEYYPFINSFID